MAAIAETAAATRTDAADPPTYRSSLVTLMRAHDTFGVWEKKSDDAILRGFVLDRQQRRAIPVIGDPDPKVLWRIEVFHTAVSLTVTRRTRLDATPFVKISSEGFGRVLITVGRLVVLARSLRDVHRFGFESTEALAAAGEALVDACLDAIERHPAVARDSE
ncbi:MAG: NifX-associated nitrogen fixation protein [Rhodospirillales bacterium]